MGFSEKILTKSLQQPKHDMIKCMILQTLSLKIIPPWGMLLYCTLSAWFDQSGNIYEVSSLLYFPNKSILLESLKLKYSSNGKSIGCINIYKLSKKSKFELPKMKWWQPKFSDAFQAIELEKLESENEFEGLNSTYN